MNKIFFGIDVHLSRFTTACLDAELRIHFVEDFTMGELIERIISVSPNIIGVDAPMGLNIGLMDDEQYRRKLGLKSDKHHNKKVSEYELTKRGIFLYPSPKTRDEITGWKSWMGTGFQLYEELKKLGYWAVNTKKLSEKVVVEVFPHSSFTTLAGRLLENKSTDTGIKERTQILEDIGISGISEYLTGSKHIIGDRLDSLVAAYTAYSVWKEQAYFIGEPDEGVIALPVKELKDRYRKEQKIAEMNCVSVLHEDNSIDSGLLTYIYKNVDAVIWLKYFTPVGNVPSIDNIINFREHHGLQIALEISSEHGKTMEATFEAMKNRVDGMKVVQSDKQRLKEFWGSHGDKQEYQMKVITINVT